MAIVEKSCMNCEHSIFCESWGEYKCLVKSRRIYEPENEAIFCDDYKRERRRVGESESKCQCKTCLSRATEE